jgi:hypothetical protein
MQPLAYITNIIVGWKGLQSRSNRAHLLIMKKIIWAPEYEFLVTCLSHLQLISSSSCEQMFYKNLGLGKSTARISTFRNGLSAF